mmetsp:Transcript_5203/g.13194  ORF Transcript_5203/g.13194 Transcript_5203/m.13194 type:complete len:233 (-) Transcript_5203:4627-5325(-)
MNEVLPLASKGKDSLSAARPLQQLQAQKFKDSVGVRTCRQAMPRGDQCAVKALSKRNLLLELAGDLVHQKTHRVPVPAGPTPFEALVLPQSSPDHFLNLIGCTPLPHNLSLLLNKLEPLLQSFEHSFLASQNLCHLRNGRFARIPDDRGEFVGPLFELMDQLIDQVVWYKAHRREVHKRKLLNGTRATNIHIQTLHHQLDSFLKLSIPQVQPHQPTRIPSGSIKPCNLSTCL